MLAAVRWSKMISSQTDELLCLVSVFKCKLITKTHDLASILLNALINFNLKFSLKSKH